MKFPDLPKTGQSVAFAIKQIIDYLRASRIVSINGIKGVESSNGTTFNIPIPKTGKDTVNLAPLEVTIFKDGEDFKIVAESAYIIPRHNESGAAGAPIAITSIPASGTPMTVTDGDKVYVKESIDVNGRVTAGVFEKATSWPTDTPPVLVGGDLSGTAGERHVRVAEFALNGDSLIKDQILTGHIDHFQPTLADNTISSASTGQARPLQQWDSTLGAWLLRYLEQNPEDYGGEITEDGDKIIVSTRGGNLNLNIENVTLPVSVDAFGDGFATKDIQGTETLYWRKGVYVGTTDPEDGSAPDDFTVSIISDPL